MIDLEEELGVQLLNRTTRSASPTENGQAYYERCLAVLADLEEADLLVSRMQAEPRGLLRVNATMSFGTLHLGRCVLEFEQFTECYRVPASVTELPEAHDFFQATYWHNHMFNPNMPPGIRVLSFKPDWPHASTWRTEA